MTEVEQKQEETLGKFIKDNHHLLVALGVFTTLSIFANSLALKSFGYFLSFMCLTATVLLWSEIRAMAPANACLKLELFKDVLSFTLYAIILYWLLVFRPIWHVLLFFPIAMFLAWPVRALRRKMRAQRHQELKGWKRYVEGILLLMVALISMGIAVLISRPVNVFFDAAYESLKTIEQRF